MLITDCQCQSCPSAYIPRRASCPSTCTPDIILISALRKRRRQLSSYKKKCMEVLTFILSNSWLINGRGSFAKQSLGYKVTLTLLTSKCKQWRLCGTIPDYFGSCKVIFYWQKVPQGVRQEIWQATGSMFLKWQETQKWSAGKEGTCKRIWTKLLPSVHH